MNTRDTVVRWAIIFVLAFVLVWCVVCLRRGQLLQASPKPDFITAAGVYAALLTGSAAALTAGLFYAARRGSAIPTPRATPGIGLFACTVLAALALDGTRYSVPDGTFHPEEVLVTLDAILGVVAGAGVVLAVKSGHMALPEPA
jgi:hypothetical protein